MRVLFLAAEQTFNREASEPRSVTAQRPFYIKPNLLGLFSRLQEQLSQASLNNLPHHLENYQQFKIAGQPANLYGVNCPSFRPQLPESFMPPLPILQAASIMEAAMKTSWLLSKHIVLLS
jgi:hypothetical protein